jgi:hypothetical protein
MPTKPKSVKSTPMKSMPTRPSHPHDDPGRDLTVLIGRRSAMVDESAGQASDPEVPVLWLFAAVIVTEGFVLLSFFVWL